MAHFWPSSFSGILTLGFLTICGSEEMTVYGIEVQYASACRMLAKKTCKRIADKLKQVGHS
jgi:hypothetical protein